MRLEIGQIIKTNYNTGPFEIKEIFRNCTCSHVLDEIERKERSLPFHTHLSLRDLKDQKPAWINYVDENTFQIFGPGGKYNGDAIELLPNLQPIQQSLI